MSSFALGPAWAARTGCCAKPEGCTNLSAACLMRSHPWKRRYAQTIDGEARAAELEEDPDELQASPEAVFVYAGKLEDGTRVVRDSDGLLHALASVRRGCQEQVTRAGEPQLPRFPGALSAYHGHGRQDHPEAAGTDRCDARCAG